MNIQQNEKIIEIIKKCELLTGNGLRDAFIQLNQAMNKSTLKLNDSTKKQD